MTAKKTTSETKTKEAKKIYIVVRPFQDNKRGGKLYNVGDTYIETSPERTKALLNAKVTDENKTGKVYIQLGK